MGAFFAHKRGSVVKVTGQWQQAGGAMPFQIVMDSLNLSGATNPNTRAIITQSSIVEQGNFQFLHTLNETIYAYVFGDRIGELRVSGICFAYPCNNNVSGMKQVIDNYRENRIAKKGGPVGVSFGEMSYKGFLVGMNLDIVDAERNLGQWTLSFNTFPGN